MTLVPQRTTRQRVIKWFLITLGITTLGIVALVIFVVVQLGGGVRWMFTSAPKATDQHVVAANTAAGAQRDRLVADLQSAGATAGLTRVTATTPNLGCSEGQHNWKINNDYDLECSTNVKLILGSAHPSESALRAQLLALHDQLGELEHVPFGLQPGRQRARAEGRTGVSARRTPAVHRQHCAHLRDLLRLTHGAERIPFRSVSTTSSHPRLPPTAGLPS